MGDPPTAEQREIPEEDLPSVHKERLESTTLEKVRPAEPPSGVGWAFQTLCHTSDSLLSPPLGATQTTHREFDCSSPFTHSLTWRLPFG